MHRALRIRLAWLPVAVLLSLSLSSPSLSAVEDDLSQTASAGSHPDTSTTMLDRAREELYETLWHGAMRVDRWFGSGSDDATYQHVYGSVSIAQLWDEHYGLRTPLRFSANLPLPQLD